MSFDQKSLENLATKYTEAWNSAIPENVAACHLSSSRITINQGEPSVGYKELTAMAAGFHSDVPDLLLRNDGIRAAGNHVVFLWTFTGHHSQSGNPLNVSGWEEWEIDDLMNITSSLGWFDVDNYERQVEGKNN